MSNDTRFNEAYSVFVGQRSSLFHGPAYIENDIFVGMESLIFNAKIENNIAIGMSSTIIWE